MEGEETLMDSLVWEGNDMTSTFVLETLQGLHMQSVTCNVNMSAVEMKHAKEMDKLIKYYRSMENLVSSKEYMKFSRDDRSSVESNFHSTMRHAEKMRNRKLQRIKTQCDSEQQEWLKEKFSLAVNHATALLSSGRSGRGRYEEMGVRVQYCREKIQQHLTTCRSNANSFGLLYCYVDELEILLRKIDEFLATMQEILRVHYGDDEDLITIGSGTRGTDTKHTPDTSDSPDDEDDQGIDIPIDPEDTEDTLDPEDTEDTLDPEDTEDTLDPEDTEDTLDPEDTEDTLDPDPDTSDTNAEDVTASEAISTELPGPSPTTIIHKMELSPDFFGVGPVIIDPHKDTPTTKTTPTTAATPTTETTPSISEEPPSDPTTTTTTQEDGALTPARREEVTPISSHSSPSSRAEVSVTGSPAGEDTAGDSTQMPRAQSTSQGRSRETERQSCSIKGHFKSGQTRQIK